jgi:hypothetical protein
MSEPQNKTIELFVNQLIDDVNQLFLTTIEKTKASDDRAKIQHVPWYERHRLHVLLDAAIETKERCNRNIVVAPWFLTELKSTIEVSKRWQNKPIWKEIEPAFVNSTNFTHTIAKLYIAEYLSSKGHAVDIIPKGTDASPDLKVQAIGGTQEWINIECYQPYTLNG